MSDADVLTVGEDPDPAKRLRRAWGSEIRRVREMHGLTLDEVAERMREIGGPDYTISAQAIGMWERGETAPKWHNQGILSKALSVPRETIFREVA